MRRNWARVTLVVLLATGIAWNTFGLVMQHVIFRGPDDLDQFETILSTFTFVIALGTCVLFGWLIKRLSSENGPFGKSFMDPRFGAFIDSLVIQNTDPEKPEC